ncbi:MAG TPA: hypothetical protein VI704_03810, partial [Bacteroidota bacterium]|nr:hypothetical protein [Bacteroidota bacterium]
MGPTFTLGLHADLAEMQFKKNQVSSGAELLRNLFLQSFEGAPLPKNCFRTARTTWSDRPLGGLANDR